ncbi:MAG: ATP-binding protein [Gemmatimonadaceae bacterium]
MRRPIRRLLPSLIALASTAGDARAQGALGYTQRYFTTESGLPSQAVTDVAQTGEGYLWVVAGGLLSRFDGKEFRSYTYENTPQLRRRVMTIRAGLGDTLWIVDQANALFALVGGAVSQVVPPGPSRIYSVAQDADGAIFAARWPDVVRLRRDRAEWEVVSSKQGAVATDSSRLWLDGRGAVWMLESASVLQRLTGSPSESQPALAPWAVLVSHATGNLLRVEANGGMLRVIEPGGEVVATYPARADRRPQLVDHDGRLWVSTKSTYEVYARGSDTPITVLERRSSLGFLYDGNSGCIWETGLALRQICRSAFREIALTPAQAGSYIEPHVGGSILRWEMTRGVVIISPDSAPRPLRDRSALLHARSHRDQRGILWWSVEAVAESGPRRVAGSEHFLPHGLAYVFADHRQFPDVIWYAAGGYLFRTVGTSAGSRVVTDSIQVGGLINALSASADGSVWAVAAMPDATSQLLHASSSKVVRYGPKDGLPAAELRAVRALDDGSVWVGTYGGGLAALHDGRFHTITAADGLAENVVTSLLTDDAGNLWMGGNRSIHRVSLAEAAQFLSGTRRRVNGVGYGKSDGLDAPETAGFPGVRDDLGRLWLPTIGGEAIVDPRLAIAFDSIVPAIHINEVITTRDSLGWSASPVRLTLGARRVTVRYAAVVMRNADGVRYQYRLDGEDDDWVDAEHTREALYSSVTPGTHTFRVRAMSAAGVPTPTEATVRFVVPAYFTETPAFYALLATIGIGLLWLAMRLRERLLVRRATELSQAVDERTGQLAKALETVGDQAAQLRTLDETKSRFFANVSHEFRTPLSLIVGPVDDLRSGRFGPLSAAAIRRLDGVQSNAQRLLRLVDQLLDIARLQSGALKLTAKVQDLVPLLRRMADSFSSLAERNGIDFRLSCPVAGLTISCDADQMEKVVANLVGNALKFTPHGGSVELVAAVDPTDDTKAVIEVIDTGPGIPREFHERVFERFFQVDDSSSRSHEGTGIGLALVRELVELHGGTVRVESTAGAGSRFIVRLPLAAAGRNGTERRRQTPPESLEAQAVTLPPPRARSVASDLVTVLLVEDNAELLEYLREHLAEHFRVLVAENGLRGLEMARRHAPDLIVSDVMMPDMDGQALCEAVKGDPETDFIPVVLLTAKASRESRLAGLSLGADDYLTKPVDLTELVIRAENLIASRRHVRERLRAMDQQLPMIRLPLAVPPRDASERVLVDRLSSEFAKHLADPEFDVQGLAGAMDMSRTTLYRKLTPLLGMSPLDALREYRLAQAAQWLSETAISVSEVAYGVGFKSVPHFSVSFRERYGESPSAYRQARRAAVR